MEQITRNIFCETGLRGCNPGFVVTSDGVVAVDSPQLPTHAVRWHREMTDRGPLRFLINTEHHVDHIFGNYFCTSAEHIIAHRACSERFMTVTPELNPYEYAKEAIPTDDPEGESLFPDAETYFAAPNRPDILISGDTVLKVGSHTISILHVPGHTEGQLAIFIPEEGVLFASDTLFHGCQTWLYASDTARWIQALERLLLLDAEIVVPGHGKVCTRNELYVQRAFLQEWVFVISNAIARGWSREECVRNISFLDRFPVDIGQEYMGGLVTRLNIEALYDTLIRNVANT